MKLEVVESCVVSEIDPANQLAGKKRSRNCKSPTERFYFLSKKKKRGRCYGARGTMGYVMLRCAMHHGMCNKTSQLLYSQDGVCVNFLPLARGTQLFQVLTFKFLFENIHVNAPQI